MMGRRILHGHLRSLYASKAIGQPLLSIKQVVQDQEKTDPQKRQLTKEEAKQEAEELIRKAKAKREVNVYAHIDACTLQLPHSYNQEHCMICLQLCQGDTATKHALDYVRLCGDYHLSRLHTHCRPNMHACLCTYVHLQGSLYDNTSMMSSDAWLVAERGARD